MAHRSQDKLDAAQWYPTITEALADRCWNVAASGRIASERSDPVPVRSVSGRLAWLAESSPGALVFGPESDGLSERDIASFESVMRIPQRRSGPSLNLAQAVAVVCSEIFQASMNPGSTPPPQLAQCSAIDRMVRRMTRIARHSGLTVRNRPEETLDALAGVFRAHDYTSHEVAVIERWLSQVEWYTGLDSNREE
jgi:tRNA/rRNA methyltransferase